MTKRLLYYSDTLKFSAAGLFMESVGKTLRDTRLARNVTLDQVSASTRICVSTLEAIESDEFSHTSSAFFYKSFVRQFAEELNLDYAQLAPAVKAAVESMPEPLMPGQEHEQPKVAALRMGRPHKIHWVGSFLSLGVMLAACSGVYAMWQNSRYGAPDALRGLALRWRAEAQRAKQPVRIASPQQAPATPTIPQQPAIAEVRPHLLSNGLTVEKPISGVPDSRDAASAYRIEVSASEPTWVSIVADGKQSFTGTMEPAETKVLEGHENARIRTGNAGGVSVVFNGKFLGPLGPRGQIRTVVFDRDRYEVLDAVAPLVLLHFIQAGE